MPADLFFFSLFHFVSVFFFFVLFSSLRVVYISFHFFFWVCVYVLVSLVGSLIQTARRYRTVWCLHHYPPLLPPPFFPPFGLVVDDYSSWWGKSGASFQPVPPLSLSRDKSISQLCIFFFTLKMREGKQKRIADHRVHTQTDTNETIGFLVPPFSLSSVSSRVVMSFDRRPAVFFFFFVSFFFDCWWLFLYFPNAYDDARLLLAGWNGKNWGKWSLKDQPPPTIASFTYDYVDPGYVLTSSLVVVALYTLWNFSFSCFNSR